MGIKLIPKVVKGWKQEENNRFGVCLVMQFTEEKSGRILFEYAPKLIEKDLWGNMFNAVEEVDKAHKMAIKVCTDLDMTFKVGINNNDCGGNEDG